METVLYPTNFNKLVGTCLYCPALTNLETLLDYVPNCILYMYCIQLYNLLYQEAELLEFKIIKKCVKC